MTRFQPGQPVTHPRHGSAVVKERWSASRGCPSCFTALEPTAVICPKCRVKTALVTSGHIYDVLCEDGKVRSIHASQLALRQ